MLTSGGRAVLQFAAPPYPPRLLQRINALCARFGDRLEVRFYAHHGSHFDFRTLESLPEVASLATDCLTRATHVEVLARLHQLTRFSFGVSDDTTPDLLDLLDPDQIRSLALSENAKRNIDLHRLAEFHRLETLYIEGHTKGIESLGELPSLTQLRLRCTPKKQTLGFVSTIPHLKSLGILLGGRQDISEITSPSLEELEIIRVRGFAHFPDLATLPALGSLHIEDQLQLTRATIPAGSTSPLTKLVINTCKKLSQLEGLAHLQHLEHLRLCLTALDLAPLLELPLPDALRTFAFTTGKARQNAAARAQLDALGYTE